MRTDLFEGYKCKFCGNDNPNMFERLDKWNSIQEGLVFCRCKNCLTVSILTYDSQKGEV
jgi:hypothetical protein